MERTTDQESSNQIQINVGHMLASEIRSVLDAKSTFPDKYGEFNRLSVLSEPLDRIFVIPDVYWKEFEIQGLALETRGLQERLDVHNNMLRLGKVLLPDPADEGTAIWQIVHEQAKPVFRASIEEASQSARETGTSGAINLTSIESPSIDGAIEVYSREVLEALKEAYDLIPEPHKVRRVSGFLLKLVGKHLPTAHYDKYNLPPGSDLPVRVSRKARRMNELLERFIANPEKELARYSVSVIEKRLTEEGAAKLDAAILTANQISVVSAPEVDQPVYMPKTKRNVITASIKESEVDNQSAVNEPAEISVAEGDYNFLGMPTVSLRWMSEGRETEVELYSLSFGEKQVLVMRAIAEGKLSDISKAVRAKIPAPQYVKTNMYDSIIDHQGAQIASGILPHTHASGIKRTNPGKNTPYANLPVWYTFNVAPNAPRVYFTLKKIAELLTDEQITQLKLEPETYTIIVLGETDKANQTDVLGAITGQTLRQLRRGGAGSI